MQTRRDQLHAYRFMTRRAMSALVTGEPDTVEPPMRRLVVTTISGLMIAIVVAAAFLVIGIIKPSPDEDWRESGTVLVERGTGSPFLMLDGKAYPALNYTSAVLASDATSTVEAEQVSRDDLASVDRGDTIGISGLPGLPPDDELSADPVTVCSRAVQEEDAASVVAEVGVEVGSDDQASELPDDEGILVETFGGEAGTTYLLWQGKRHLVDAAVIGSLGYSGVPTVKVGRAFLTALPLGSAFETPDIKGLGERRPIGGGTSLKVGQLVRVAEEEGAYRLMLDDGLVTVNDVQVRLLRTLDFGGNRPQELALPAAVLAGITPSQQAGPDLAQQTVDLPSTVPTPSEEARAVGGACASFRDGETEPRLAVPPGERPPSDPEGDSELSAQGLADVVTVPPGTGVLAQAPLGSAVDLISEPGVRYTAATLQTLAGFGYSNETPVRLPAELLAIIPPGGVLDPEAARRPAGSADS